MKHRNSNKIQIDGYDIYNLIFINYSQVDDFTFLTTVCWKHKRGMVMMENLTHVENWNLKKKAKNWLELKNVGWFGLDLRIFNLTHQKRSEAKVDLGGHFKNMSK